MHPNERISVRRSLFCYRVHNLATYGNGLMETTLHKNYKDKLWSTAWHEITNMTMFSK